MSNRFEFVTPAGKSFVMYAKDEADLAAKAKAAGHILVHGSIRPIGRWDATTGQIVDDPYDVQVEGDVHARPPPKKHLNGVAKGTST